MVKARNLTREIATVAKDITYPAYGGIMRPGDEVLIRQGGSRGLAIYDELECDAWVYACLHKRKMAVIARPWFVEPASSSRLDKRAADVVKAHVDALGFDPMCYHLLDAILKGYSVGEILWARDGAELVPAEVRPRDGRRFAFGDDYALRLLTPESPLFGEPVPERKFIVHTMGAKDGNPHGLGLGQKLWWPVFFKRQGVSFWLQFLDKFGAPTVVGKYMNGTDVQALEDALRRISRDTGVAVPDSAVVELMEAKRAGTGTHDTLVRYMDEQIAAAIIMDGGGRGGGGGELAAAAILRNELRIELVQFDADMLSATLQQSLVTWDAELNVPGAQAPRLWREVKQEEDLNKRAERDEKLFHMGFRPSKAYVNETYGGEWTLEAAPEADAPKPDGGKGPPSRKKEAVEFAGGEPEEVAGQTLFDAGMNEFFKTADLQGQAEALIRTAMNRLEQAGSYEEALESLAEIYTDLDDSALVEALSRALFVAELFGRDVQCREIARGD